MRRVGGWRGGGAAGRPLVAARAERRKRESASMCRYRAIELCDRKDARSKSKSCPVSQQWAAETLSLTTRVARLVATALGLIVARPRRMQHRSALGLQRQRMPCALPSWRLVDWRRFRGLGAFSWPGALLLSLQRREQPTYNQMWLGPTANNPRITKCNQMWLGPTASGPRRFDPLLPRSAATIGRMLFCEAEGDVGHSCAWWCQFVSA